MPEKLKTQLNFFFSIKNNSEIIDIAKDYLAKAYKNMKFLDYIPKSVDKR